MTSARMRLYSTPRSVQQGKFSLAAAGEVIVAVILYWCISIWLHTQVHLWISIVIAPLLLLRSKASVSLGVLWVEKYVHHGFRKSPQQAFKSITTWVAAVASGVSVVLVTYWLASRYLAGPASWSS